MGITDGSKTCYSCDGTGEFYFKPTNFRCQCQLCFGTGEAQICDVCLLNIANGTVGSLTDANVFIMTCSNCYYNVLKMRPLGAGIHPID